MGRWRSIVKEAVDRTAIVAKFLCFLHVTNTYICSPTLVYGPSMLPTLNLTGDVLLAEHVSHRLGKIGPGDVVLVRSPLNPRKTVTKRIVGMEGDRVTFLADPSNSDRCQTAMEIVTKATKLLSIAGEKEKTQLHFVGRKILSARKPLVPKGHVWIQGDNMYASRDSRHFGPVPYGLIQGKVFYRVWPPDSFGTLG